MSKMKIIASAGAWGYGPCSTLRLLLNRLSEFADIDFVGASVALDFALKHKHQFEKIYEQIDLVQGRYDMAISIMEPDILLWAKKFGIPSVSVDNLYWMWTWNDELLSSVSGITDKIGTGSDIRKIRNILHDKGEYADYSAMYTLSEKIYWQRFHTSFPDNLKLFKEKIQIIDPLIEKSLKEEIGERDKILVSLSGMINPYVDSTDLYTYMLVVKKLLDKTQKKYAGSKEFVFAVHDSVLNTAKKIFQTENVYSFSHPDFVSILNRSLLTVAPAGMAMIYECLAYNVPLFTLPEQHDGSYVNYKALCEGSNEKEETIFRETFPEAMLSTRFEGAKNFQIHEFYDHYLKEIIKERSPLLNEMSSLLLDVVEKVDKTETSRELASRQKELVRDIVGHFDGVEELIQSLAKQCG